MDAEGLPAIARPEDLPSLVETRAATRLDLGMVESEGRVRRAYGLPEVAAYDLARRSWVDRTRDLIRDGWERLRGVFRSEGPIVKEPRPLPYQWESGERNRGEMRNGMSKAASDLVGKSR